MKEVAVSFESEGVDGIVAVGTYLMDAAKRLGVVVDDDCRSGEDEHFCSMKISKGADLLSDPTSIEIEVLGEDKIKSGERLSCQARLDRPGEISVMAVNETKEKAAEKEREETPEEGFRQEFESMPLDRKLAALVELEAIALGETFSYVINSPFDAAGKVMDVLAGFGRKKDDADHEAKKAEEHIKAEAEEKKATAAKSSAKKRAKKSSSKAGKDKENDAS